MRCAEILQEILGTWLDKMAESYLVATARQRDLDNGFHPRLYAVLGKPFVVEELGIQYGPSQAPV